MMNDSVREEMFGKVSVVVAKPSNPENKINPMPNQTLPTVENSIAQTPSDETPKLPTGELAAKPTNPTLVEFHSKNAAVPEWRLQLQNAVQQRKGKDKAEATIETPPPATRAKLVTSGANALKAEPLNAPKPAAQKNPDLARALKRIAESRQKFLVQQQTSEIAPAAPKSSKNFPFYIASKTNEADIKPAEPNPSIASFAKPKLAEPLMVGKQKLDTNKLPPLPTIMQKATVIAEEIQTPPMAQTAVKVAAQKTVRIEETEIEEYDDDNPTFAMRFNAGLFDLIIGSFVSLCLLAPFMLAGGEWLSGTGFLAFAATCAIVMFVYLTTTIGFYGKTFGMRLFSLELIDIGGEDYPTFHQAAVNSSVYLLSLALGGIGFLTVFFNEDKRAVHDLVSKTIIVKE